MYRKHPTHVLCMALPSGFNLEAFANSSFEGEGDTRRLLVEEKEYNATVVGPFGEEKATRLRVTDKGQTILDVVWQLDDPEQAQRLGLQRMPSKRQSIFLDITPGGGLDMSEFKNGDLNRLRDVFGLNQPGVNWKFSDFVGRTATVKLKNSTNKDDPDNPYQNIVAVAKSE